MDPKLKHRAAARRLAGALLALSATVGAQGEPCGGNGGAAATTATPGALGAPFTLGLQGLPGAAYLLAMSDASATVPAPPYGVVCLDTASAFFAPVLLGTFGASGGFPLAFTPPVDPFWDAVTIFAQLAVDDVAAPGGIALSALRRVDFAPPDGFEAAGTAAVGASHTRPGFASGVRLHDGRVLIAAGHAQPFTAGAPSGIEVHPWRPAFRAFGAPASLPNVGAFHGATTLLDGRVLYSGGVVRLIPGTGPATSGSASSASRLYDPAAATPVAAGPAIPMTAPRFGHATTLLADGRALAIGGSGVLSAVAFEAAAPFARTDAETFDPATNQWTPVAGALNVQRIFATATRLLDGRVLVVGGVCGAAPIAAGGFGVFGPPVAELFDPATEQFSVVAGPTADGLAGHRATLLPDGRVWVTGGAVLATTQLAASAHPAATASTWLFDPATSAWAAGPALPAPACFHAATALPDGRVHVSGGAALLDLDATGANPAPGANLCALFDGAALTPAAPLPIGSAGASGHAAVALDDGSLLIGAGVAWSQGPATGAAPAFSVDRYVPAP
ncbi:MAG TPA: kelch repeat-containing protein [Planctomycetota bacterium]|nr:kelch repeat-containing protein [Planctomycetota bacterium]